MSELKEQLLKAINDIDFDNMCINQLSAIEKALVMLQTKWDNWDTYKANNLVINADTKYSPTREAPHPTWNWGQFHYSIIPENKTVSLDFSDADRLRDVWIKRKNKVAEFKILGLNDIGVYLFDVFLSYQELQKNYTFLDGTPIDKEVEV